MSTSLEFQATLLVAPGSGRLLRRAGACLFVPAPCNDHVAALISHVLGIDGDLVETLSDYIVAHDDTPPFVLVTWPTDRVDEGIQLVLRGDAEATTDMASVPSLSGLGSTTWVEHRIRRTPARASIHSADPGAPGTSLTSGVVPAGGFSLHLADPDLTADAPRSDAEPPTSTCIAAEPDATPIPPAPAPAPAPAPSEPTAAPPTPAPAPAPPISVGLAALRAATGRIEPDPAPAAELAAAQTSADHAASAAQKQTPIDDTTVGPPAFPGTFDNDDPEVTLGPDDRDPVPTAPVQRLVQATMCAAGHSNPPHQTRCRVCDLELDDDTTVTVDQPILAVAELPGGRTIAIDGDVVLGRNPSAVAARLDNDHQLVAFDAPGSVSRTHAILSAAGWSITVTDCGSQGGSALVPAGSDEPIELTAWVPHELNGGDVVYLGGPTPVRILDVPG